VVQQTFESITPHLSSAHQMDQDARIEVATARSHRNASGRCQPHAGVHREAIFYCHEARTIPEVCHHKAAREIVLEPVHDGFIRQAMKTIAPDPLPKKIAWQGKSRGSLWQSAVKRRVKTGKLRDLRLELLRLSDQPNGGRNMKRSEMNRALQFLEHFG